MHFLLESTPMGQIVEGKYVLHGIYLTGIYNVPVHDQFNQITYLPLVYSQQHLIELLDKLL